MLSISESKVTIQPDQPVPPNMQTEQQQQNIELPQQLWIASQLSKVHQQPSVDATETLQTDRDNSTPISAHTDTTSKLSDRHLGPGPGNQTVDQYQFQTEQVQVQRKSAAQRRYEQNSRQLVSREDALRGRGQLSKLQHEQKLREHPELRATFSRIGRDTPVIGKNIYPVQNSEPRAVPNRTLVQPKSPVMTLPDAQNRKDLTTGNRFGTFQKEERTNDYSDYMINYKGIKVKSPNKPSAAMRSPNRDQVPSQIAQRMQSEIQIKLYTKGFEKVRPSLETEQLPYKQDPHKVADATRKSTFTPGKERSPLKSDIRPRKVPGEPETTENDYYFAHNIVPPRPYEKAVKELDKEQAQNSDGSPWRQWAVGGVSKEVFKSKANKIDSQQYKIEQQRKQNAQNVKVQKEEQEIKKQLLKQDQRYQKNLGYFPDKNARNFQAVGPKDHQQPFNGSPQRYKSPDMIRDNNVLNYGADRVVDRRKVAELKLLNKKIGQTRTDGRQEATYIKAIDAAEKRDSAILEKRKQMYLGAPGAGPPPSRQGAGARPASSRQVQRTASPKKPVSSPSFRAQVGRDSAQFSRTAVGLKPTETLCAVRGEAEEGGADAVSAQLQQVFKYPNGAAVSKNVAAQVLDKLASKVQFLDERRVVLLEASRTVPTAKMLREESRGAAIEMAKQTGRSSAGSRVLALQDTEWSRRHREEAADAELRRKHGQLEVQRPLSPEERRAATEAADAAEKRQRAFLSTERRTAIPDLDGVGREVVASRGAVEWTTNIAVPACTMLRLGADGRLHGGPGVRFDQPEIVNATPAYIRTYSPQRLPPDLSHSRAPAASRLQSERQVTSQDLFYDADGPATKALIHQKLVHTVLDFGRQADRLTAEKCNKVAQENKVVLNDLTYKVSYKQIDPDRIPPDFGSAAGRE